MVAQILIAEDNPDLQVIFDAAFEHEGFEVLIAADGHEAIKLLDNSPLPRALILDLNMPGASGMDVLEHMRQHGMLEHVTIIVVTGNAIAGRFIDSKLVDMVLIKPVEPLDLVSLTKRQIRAARRSVSELRYYRQSRSFN